jgi:pimeloyl-ACP methyl ester carboxylesterase
MSGVSPVLFSYFSRPIPQRRRARFRAVFVPTLLGALVACDGGPSAPSRSQPWEGERSLDVGGVAIHARFDGLTPRSGTPTVVLMSGLDTPLEVWQAVRGPLAAHAAVLSYDRGGIGRSAAVDSLRPSSAVAKELYGLLSSTGAKPPYLLVAHSLAGVHARVFAARYPGLVSGLVLVDATHETLLDMLGPDDVQAIAADQQFAGAQAEVRAQRTSLTELRAAPLPDVPLVVLTSMIGDPGEPAGVRDWLAALQGEWVQLVSRGEQVRVAAGHMIPLEAPETIVSAVRRLLPTNTSALAR